MLSISSAHALHVRGAKHFIDEVDESRRVVDRVEALLRGAGIAARKFHDDTSRTQSANLNAITNWHRQRAADIHVTIHFNAAHPVTDKPRGTEVLHKSQPALAARVSLAIANAGKFINRGAKLRGQFAFLNRLSNALIVEVCFVDSRADSALYNQHFQAICHAIASSISGRTIGEGLSPPAPPVQPPSSPPIQPPSPSSTTSRPTLRVGSRGDDVRILQTALRISADGIFGPITAAAVEAFQAKHGLVIDGIVGPRSWAVLEREFNLS